MPEVPDWKCRLQSQTVRAVALAAVVSVANALVAVFDMNIDVGAVEFWADTGIRLLGEGLTLTLLWRAYRGRMKADTPIKPLPWKDEIKTTMNKGERK
jgi:hypothetical protein